MSSKPVIDSVSPAGPITAQVGTKVKLTVVAHDDDTRTENITLIMQDAAGNQSLPVVVPFQWVDGLTLLATSSAGSPVSVNGQVVTVG